MPRFAALAFLLVCAACERQSPRKQYLFVWAGDSARTASDFLGVIDADTSSATYGQILTSLPTGVPGTHPHHTEGQMPANGHLLANGFHAGKTWLFDLTQPLAPKILTTFGDVGGYSHPHTYVRLANGNVLATFQYRAASATSKPMTMSMPMGSATSETPTTGALVEMDERGTVVRVGAARDTSIADRRLFPYSAMPMPMLDRVVSTTTNMDPSDTASTAQWVQFWRLSDLTLLKSIALKPGPRGDENQFTGEPRLLPDGKSVYIHTFNCGLYLVRDIASAIPSAEFVRGFPGKDCGVPLLVGNYWLQPIPSTHSLDAFDVSVPERPKLVSSVSLGEKEVPHWIAVDSSGTRVVLNSGGSLGNMLFVINLDRATGKLTIDERFRDKGASTPGVSMSAKRWPHGFTGVAYPHGTVFSR